MPKKQQNNENAVEKMTVRIEERQRFFDELAEAEDNYKKADREMRSLRSELSNFKYRLNDECGFKGVVVSEDIPQMVDPEKEVNIKYLEGEIAKIEAGIEKLLPVHCERKETVDTLRNKFKTSFSVTPDDLLRFQEIRDSQVERIAQIESAIEKNNEELQGENEATVRHHELCEQKETLLASIALNEGNHEALDGINKQIAVVDAEIREQQDSSAAFITSRAQTISGLRKMLQETVAAKEQTDFIINELLTGHLLCRAEEFASEYAKAAVTIEKSFKRLLGIQEVLDILKPPRERINILGSSVELLNIPDFEIEGCKAQNNNGFLFSFQHGCGGDFQEKEAAMEMKRLTDLGVCLPL